MPPLTRVTALPSRVTYMIPIYGELTRHNVPEADGGEGDEAEVEGGEEAPVLPLDGDMY